jgi:hypothetical protein
MLSCSEASLRLFPQHDGRGTGRRFLVATRNGRKATRDGQIRLPHPSPFSGLRLRSPGIYPRAGPRRKAVNRHGRPLLRAGAGRCHARDSAIHSPIGSPGGVSPGIRQPDPPSSPRTTTRLSARHSLSPAGCYRAPSAGTPRPSPTELPAKPRSAACHQRSSYSSGAALTLFVRRYNRTYGRGTREQPAGSGRRTASAY